MSSNEIRLDVGVTSLSVSLKKTCLTVFVETEAGVDAESSPIKLSVKNAQPSLVVSTTKPTEVAVVSEKVLTALVGAQGPAGASGTGQELVSVLGFDTSNVEARRAVYASAEFEVSHAYAETMPHAWVLGVFTGQLGRVQTAGLADVDFLASSPTPVPGRQAFLVRLDSELGAAGKLSASPPTSGFVGVVGTIVAVPADFASSRRATINVRDFWVTKRG